MYRAFLLALTLSASIPTVSFAAFAKDVALADELRPSLATPFPSTAAALDALAATSRILLAHRDRRALFATTYLYTTTEYRRMLAEGRFSDPASFERLTTVFANLYRAALWADVRGTARENAEAWRIAFGATGDEEVSPTLLLLLSVNAHVTHDLPLALLASGEDLSSAAEKADYDAFNEAFRIAVGKDWDLLDRFGHPHGPVERAFEGRMALAMVYGKRANAWSDASYLASLPDPEKAEGRQWLEDKSSRLAETYLGWKSLVR